MSFDASGLALPTWIDILDTTQLAIDLDLETHKVALFNNSITVTSATYSTMTAYGVAPWNANEVTDALSSYVAGGKVVTGTTVSESPTGTLMWDASDVSWATSSIVAARGALIYADALAGNNAIVGINFGADYTTSSGTFQIQWASGGILTIDLTP